MNVVARVEALSAGNHRVSRGYKLAAWMALAAAVFVWLPFSVAAAGFYFGGFLLRREGL